MAEPAGGHCQPPQAHGGPLLHHPHSAGTNEGRVWTDKGPQAVDITFPHSLFLPKFSPQRCSLYLYKLPLLNPFFHHCSETIPLTFLSLPSHSVQHCIYLSLECLTTPSSTCYTSCFSSGTKQIILQCHLASSHHSDCPSIWNNTQIIVHYIALNLH